MPGKAVALAAALGLAATVAFGFPVNTIEPTEWTTTVTLHNAGTSTDSYWGRFPNGDNVDFGLFRLGHRWQAGAYAGSPWNSNFDTSEFFYVDPSPLSQAILGQFSYPFDPTAFWAFLCPLDSDGDGFSNGVELGDPNCLFPGTQPATPALSDPNDAASVPPTTTTTTTTTTVAPTTAAPTTAAPTTAAPTTAAPTNAPTAVPTNAPTAAPTNAPTAAPTNAPTAAPTTETNAPGANDAPATTATNSCTSWYTFDVQWGSSATTFTTKGCKGSAVGDPHYETLSGTFVTCDNLGWTTLVESAEAKVEVEHVAVGATTATAVANARVTFKSSGRTVVFGANPDVDASSDEAVLVNANGATDVSGRNYVEVQRVKTTFGTFLNVQTIFAEPVSGILVDGCPTGAPVYASASVAESAACADISDRLARYACNADVQRTGSDEFVVMAKGAEQQRSQVQQVEAPASASAVAPRTRSVSTGSSGAGVNVVIVVVVMASLAVVAMAVIIVVVVLRRKPQDQGEAARPAKIVYVTSGGDSLDSA